MTIDNNHQHFAEDVPLSKTALDLSSNGQGFGLIIVDEVNGFAPSAPEILLLKFPMNRYQ